MQLYSNLAYTQSACYSGYALTDNWILRNNIGNTNLHFVWSLLGTSVSKSTQLTIAYIPEGYIPKIGLYFQIIVQCG